MVFMLTTISQIIFAEILRRRFDMKSQNSGLKIHNYVTKIKKSDIKSKNDYKLLYDCQNYDINDIKMLNDDIKSKSWHTT